MKKSKLATALCAVLYRDSRYQPDNVIAMRNADVIELFTTCAECGEPVLWGKRLKQAIGLARCTQEFCDLCNEYGDNRGCHISHINNNGC